MEAKRDAMGSLRILIVEDEADTANSMATLLRLYGHEVLVAGDGFTALQMADDHSPDVVLLDLGIPKMDGWKLAKALRQRHPPKRPVLIAISGYGDQAALRRSHEAGIDLHLVKPVDCEELKQLLRTYQKNPSAGCQV
jgi:CheY-like chemotaxis protein